MVTVSTSQIGDQNSMIGEKFPGRLLNYITYLYITDFKKLVQTPSIDGVHIEVIVN